MRLVFKLISLLIALAVVGLLTKRQLVTERAEQDVAFTRQTITDSTGLSFVNNPGLQAQQITNHVEQSLEATMKIPKIVDED